MDSFLNLDDLYASHIQRDKNKLKFYEELYKRCVQKIKKTNKDRQQFTCCFNIPGFIFGGPVYDFQEMKRYLIFKLRNNGLYVEDLDYNTIYISWKPQDINRSKYEQSFNKLKERLETKYNVIESNVLSKEIKNKKNGTNNALHEVSNVGMLQYNNKVKDMIPINPKKLSRYKPLANFPVTRRANNYDTMMNGDTFQ